MAAKWTFLTSHARQTDRHPRGLAGPRPFPPPARRPARQTRASTRRSRRAVSICSLIVTRPSGQPRSGNWTL